MAQKVRPLFGAYTTESSKSISVDSKSVKLAPYLLTYLFFSSVFASLSWCILQQHGGQIKHIF